MISSCESPSEETINGVNLDLQELSNKLYPLNLNDIIIPLSATIPSSIPRNRSDLESMKTIVQIFNGNQNAGISIPAFAGLTLGREQSNLNVYYIEAKIVESSTDTIVYGIGYSIHYLFSKVKKGIDVKNLASVAASAQLQGNKTSVSYSLQSYGISGKELSKFFKPEVNSNFDVDGFGVIQSKINGIHNVITDSLLSSRTKFTPEKLSFLNTKN